MPASPGLGLLLHRKIPRVLSLFLLKATQDVSRRSRVFWTWFQWRVSMAPPRWAAPRPGTPRACARGLCLLPLLFPKAVLRKQDPEGKGELVGSQLACLPALTRRAGITVAGLSVLGVGQPRPRCWCSPDPMGQLSQAWGRPSRPGRSAVGPQVPHLLASPAPRKLSQDSLWLSGKEPTCPCEGTGLIPESGKIPRAWGQPSPCERAESLQWCPILCNPLDGNLPGSS